MAVLWSSLAGDRFVDASLAVSGGVSDQRV